MDNLESNQMQNDELASVEYFIPMDVDAVMGLKYDKKEFERGIKEASYIAGFISCLANAGVSPVETLGYFMNKDNIEHNQKLQDKINKSALEVAKEQSIKVENIQL